MSKEKFGGRFKQTATQKAKGQAADKAIKQAATVVAAAAGAAMAETKRQEKGNIGAEAPSPEWAAAVAIVKGDPSLAPPELRAYVKEEIEKNAQAAAEQAEKERLEREAKKAEKAAAKAAKAEGKPRRFPFFGGGNG